MYQATSSGPLAMSRPITVFISGVLGVKNLESSTQSANLVRLWEQRTIRAVYREPLIKSERIRLFWTQDVRS
jgi:hypothetical protein